MLYFNLLTRTCQINISIEIMRIFLTHWHTSKYSHVNVNWPANSNSILINIVLIYMKMHILPLDQNEINIHNVKLWYQHTKIYYNITKLKTKNRLVDILTSAVVILNMIPSCIPNLVKLLTHSHAYFQSTKCYYTQLKSFYFDIWKEINQYKFNTVFHETKKPTITWAV